MGLMLDSNSSVSFTKDAPFQDDMRWHEPALMYQYSVTVRSDPKAPKPRTPKKDENWRVGIVQNVMFQSIVARYAKTLPKIMSLSKPLVDAADSSQLPFYSGSVPFELDVTLQGIHRTLRLWKRASAEATFGPSGFHFKPPPGTKRSPTESDDEVLLEFFDMPRFSYPLHFGNDTADVLMETNHLITMQIWIVAIGSGPPITLARSGKFTLVMWMKFPVNVERGKALDPVTPKFNSEGLPGVVKKLPDNFSKDVNWKRFVRQATGSVPFHEFGNAPEAIKGPLAIDEASRWMKKNGLMPP